MTVPTLKTRKSIFETTSKEPKSSQLTCTTWLNANDPSTRPQLEERRKFFFFFFGEYILKRNNKKKRKKKEPSFTISMREKERERGGKIEFKRSGNCVPDPAAAAPSHWRRRPVSAGVPYSWIRPTAANPYGHSRSSLSCLSKRLQQQ